MAWYDVFEYENASDKYIRMEKERERRYQNRRLSTIRTPQKAPIATFEEPAPEEIEPYAPQEAEFNPQTIEQQYVFNKMNIFKGLKEPDFDTTIKVKTTKPGKSFGSYLAKFNARPLVKAKKVYKFKTVDTDTGASVITQQKEIEVFGENEHNYFYVTKDGIQTVSKQEVSNSPIDGQTLRLKFMQQVNKQAKDIARLKTPDSQLKYEQRPFKLTEAIKGGLGEVKDTATSYLGGIVHQLTQPLEAVGDAIVAKDTPQKIRSLAQGVLHEAAPMFVGDPATDPWIKEDPQGYIHDDEAFKEIKLEVKDGKLTEESKKALDEYNKKLESMKRHPYPKGYSKETDAMAAGKSKAQISAARQEDKEDTIKTIMMGKDETYEMDLKEKIGMTLGELTGIVLEFIALDKIGGAATIATKSKIAAHVIKNAIAGGSFGILEKLKERDATAVEYIMSAAKEAAFFIAGEGAAKGIEKGIGPTRSLLGTLGKKTARGAGFGTAGTTAALPFMTKEERTPENIAMMIGSGMLFEVGGEMLGRGVAKLKPKAKIPKTLKPVSTFEKTFKLDTPLKGVSKKLRASMANKTTKKLLDEIGTKIKSKIGSLEPKKIMEYYKNKYNLGSKTTKITLDKTLKGESNYARIEFIKENKKIKEIEVRINTDKSEKEIAAGLRHEIEHALDKQRGYVKPEKDVFIKKPSTLREYMEKGMHHEKYKNFEIEYLENIYKTEGLVKSDTARKMQIFKEIKTAPKTKRSLLYKELGSIKQRERERMGLELIPEGSNLANEKLHARNKMLTNASNLPVYAEPKQKLGTKIKSFWDKFYTKMVNRQHAMDKMGKRVKMTSQNYVNHHATADYINTQKLVDRKGGSISTKSLKDVIVAPKGLQAEYESYLFHKHHIARMKQGKPVLFEGKEAIPIKDAKNIVEAYEKQFPEFKKHSSELNQFLDDFMREWMVDSGLMTAAEYKKMKFLYPEYVPTFRKVSDMGFDPRVSVVKASPLKKATGGTEQLIPLVESLPFQVQKIIRAQRRNKLHQEILTTILEAPEDMQKFGEVVNTKKLNRMKGELLAKVKSFSEKEYSLGELSKKFDEFLVPQSSDIKGNHMIVMENGKPLLVKINDESLWKALTKVQNANVSSQNEILRNFDKYVTKNFKGAVTQYNPFFAVRNIARDVPTAYIQGSVHDPFTFTKNLFMAGWDKFFKKDLYKKFEALGGSSANITYIQKVENSLQKFKGVRKGLDFIAKFLNLAGDYSETMPRYAEFKHVYKKGLKKGKSEEQALEEALYAAKEVTINFSRGGEYTKEFEPVIPYMNAGVQGFDKWMRSLFIEGAAKGNFAPILKAFGVTMLPTVGLHFLNYMWNKEGYKDLPDYVVDHNYVVPAGDDHYLKVPKTRETGFIFSTLFQRMHRHFIEKDPDAFKGLGDTFIRTYLDPVTSVAQGGFPGPILNLVNKGNTDYFGRPIEPLSKRDKMSKRYITKETTSKASKALGPILEKFGLSPAQADYFVKSYAGVLADMYMSINDVDETWKEKVMRGVHLFHDTRYSGKAQSKLYDTRDEATKAVKDFEVEQGIDELKKRLKAKGLTANKFIDAEIRDHLGPTRWKKYLDLKEQKKQAEKRLEENE